PPQAVAAPMATANPAASGASAEPITIPLAKVRIPATAPVAPFSSEAPGAPVACGAPAPVAPVAPAPGVSAPVAPGAPRAPAFGFSVAPFASGAPRASGAIAVRGEPWHGGPSGQPSVFALCGYDPREVTARLEGLAGGAAALSVADLRGVARELALDVLRDGPGQGGGMRVALTAATPAQLAARARSALRMSTTGAPGA